MKLTRSCGVLMHITSLPGAYGTGTLGKEAYDFADFLEKAGQQYWQILPHGPVLSHLEYCPYVSPSTFAGNNLFINLEKLAEKKWMPANMIPARRCSCAPDFADFREAECFLIEKMRLIFPLFMNEATSEEKNEFENFCARDAWWLDDYALFTALSEYFGTCRWVEWDHDIMVRDPGAISAATRKYAKRQLTWFRNRTSLRALVISDSDPSSTCRALALAASL